MNTNLSKKTIQLIIVLLLLLLLSVVWVWYGIQMKKIDYEKKQISSIEKNKRIMMYPSASNESVIINCKSLNF